jgi:hypothetical protein
MSTEICGFAWFDGAKSHVCRETGEHEHNCRYCHDKYDPRLYLEPGPKGGFIKRYKPAKD